MSASRTPAWRRFSNSENRPTAQNAIRSYSSATLFRWVGGVSAPNKDPAVVLEHDQRPAPGDALAGELGLLLGELFGRDVEGNAHRSAPFLGAGGDQALGRLPGLVVGGPPAALG